MERTQDGDIGVFELGSVAETGLLWGPTCESSGLTGLSTCGR